MWMYFRRIACRVSKSVYGCLLILMVIVVSLSNWQSHLLFKPGIMKSK